MTAPLPNDVEQAVCAIEAQLAVQLGRASRVFEAAETLDPLFAESAPSDESLCWSVFERLRQGLLPRRGEAAQALLEKLEGWAWSLDAGQLGRGSQRAAAELLTVRDRALRRQLLARLQLRAEQGELVADDTLLERLGALLEEDPDDERALALACRLLAEEPATAREVMLGRRGDVRCLAARVLDAAGPLEPTIARELLGDEAARFFEPYLEYTRASHRELCDLLGGPHEAPPALASLREAERLLGQRQLAELIGELGWSRLSWGLHVEREVAVSVDGGYPLALRPEEVSLLDGCGEVQELGERVLVIAHGRAAASGSGGEAQKQAVDCFRRYNVAHAEALAEIMEVAPLTPAKVRRTIALIDHIVEGYRLLFSEQEEGSAELPRCWRELRAKAEAALARAPEGEPLDAETTRLVQMFEEPRRVGEVTTIHGLKRYLHQAGLRHAFSRFRAGQAANCTVDLALLAPRQPPFVVQRLRFLDFEPGELRGVAGLPLPVASLARAFLRQVAAGQRKLPHVEALVYGNEVQVYVSFRNHPAFLRVDFSPPLRGGMVDLEYYGVSQYELDQHPDLSLWAIQQFFVRAGFHVVEERLRLHVRFDKEAAFDFAAILEQADALFHLLPYLMDVDWIVGSLDYPETTRQAIVDGWADHWLRYGVLPVDQLLSADRRRIRLGRRESAAGSEELCWDGRGPYRDAFTGRSPHLWQRLQEALAADDLDELLRFDELRGQGPGQLPLERAVLGPLRAARRRGEVVVVDNRLRRASPEDFQRDHPAERLARRLLRARELGPGELYEAGRSAVLLRVIEGQLRWQPAGSINGYEVVSATLALRGHRLEVFALRDGEAIAQLALVVDEGGLYRQRVGEAWRESAEVSASELAAWLRRDNYLANAALPPPEQLAPTLTALMRQFERPVGRSGWRPDPDDRLVAATVASPGRAAGFARLGRSRDREDLRGQVLVVGAITPEDSPALVAAAAIVSTGGGILSHAGLTALELGKPALMIPGELRQQDGESPRLRYRRAVFSEDERQVGPFAVCCRRPLEEREEQIDEGDLLVVDGDAASVQVLGRDSEVLAVHGELAALAAEEGEGDDPRRALARRGRLLRAYHQLEKLFARTSRPALACYALWALLSGRRGGGEGERRACGAALRALFANPRVGAFAQRSVAERYRGLLERREALAEGAREGIGEARNLFEVALLLSRLGRAERLADDVGRMLAELFGGPFASPIEPFDLTIVRERLEAQRASAKASLEDAPPWRAAHLRADLQRLDALLGESSAAPVDPIPSEGSSAPRRLLLDHRDGGLELREHVGGKAAHLGELCRALDGRHVPPYVVVTDAGLQALLAASVLGGGTLGEELRQTLATQRDPARAAARCADLWRAVEVPSPLESELRSAYDRIAPIDALGERPFVAVRSSGVEEDSEDAAWAGAFDTFLFVRGFSQLLGQLRAAFASFWGERALRLRSGSSESEDESFATPQGGVVIQRMVDARAAGVLYSAAAVGAEPRDMVLNVGLGQGEGVVSGRVEVDQIIVPKRSAPEPELRFAYHVGDKREQVVFDRERGEGTTLAATLYHQRLRPALEYSDLRELVDVALHLEQVFARPLDIEFAFEGSSLAILQARPIPVYQAAYRELAARAALFARRSR